MHFGHDTLYGAAYIARQSFQDLLQYYIAHFQLLLPFGPLIKKGEHCFSPFAGYSDRCGKGNEL